MGKPAQCELRRVQAYPRHSLSRAALATAGVPIFLMDAFSELIVLYDASAPADTPFPPLPQVWPVCWQLVLVRNEGWLEGQCQVVIQLAEGQILYQCSSVSAQPGGADAESWSHAPCASADTQHWLICHVPQGRPVCWSARSRCCAGPSTS